MSFSCENCNLFKKPVHGLWSSQLWIACSKKFQKGTRGIILFQLDWRPHILLVQFLEFRKFPSPGPRLRFVFDGPGPEFVFDGPGSQFVFTGPALNLCLSVLRFTVKVCYTYSVYLGAVYMRKITPPRWAVSSEWDLGIMVYFTL